MHVLLVEDDDLVASGIGSALEIEGFAVDRVATAAEADATLIALTTDLVILDIGLTDRDGLSLLRDWRAAGRREPVLVLTARDAVADRVAGLSAGGDDYLLKPFDLDELLARVRALLRRAAGFATPVLEHGALCFNTASRQTTVAGRPITLTRRETALLERLLHAGPRIVSADQLKDSLYGFDAEIEGNALSVHIHNLRRKLGRDVVETVRGVGYRLGPAGGA
ncbi:response regulator [Salinisphaera hydrothermalis]|uniref:Two-component system response regulator n=1 Tax=Salinisphaera hydrothermalis (strain C41B8) TaxID=1304275 RepID=A0A084IP08_SALHC|nr:response regulator [Salinisphaera hydrothermalis]KEZ78442.1 two-component system response regulator [Salinisphaera hydrothermalis C41B8]